MHLVVVFLSGDIASMKNISNKISEPEYTNTVIYQHHIAFIKRNHANKITHNNPLQLPLTLLKPNLITSTDKQLTL